VVYTIAQAAGLVLFLAGLLMLIGLAGTLVVAGVITVAGSVALEINSLKENSRAG